MGAGKSAVGALLARSLDRRFIDTDSEIERAAGMSVAEIFATEGESWFRSRERQAIDELSEADAVVALGGGAIAQSGVAALLERTGSVIYLKASPDSLLARLADGSGRPLLEGLAAAERRAKIEGLLAKRANAYETAEIEVDTDGRTLEAVVEEIRRRLGRQCEGREPQAGKRAPV